MIRIFLCSYNGEAYIEEQIRSILNQETGEELELLVSDDCSGDATVDILYRLQRDVGERRLRILKRDMPGGSACRHFLSLFEKKYFQGADYIMLSDQDDVWKRDKLSRSLEKIREKEAELGREHPILLHTDSSVTDDRLREISPSFTAYQRMSPGRDRLSQLLVQNHVVGGSIMLNRALAERLSVMPEHAVMHDHWMALTAAAFGSIIYIPESLYFYRQHGENAVGAERGSRISEVLKRLGMLKGGRSREEMDEHSRSVYRALFLQAEDFLRIYGADLSEEQKWLIGEFVSIPKKSRVGKIYTVIRHGFTYNMLHRTIGELIFI